MCIASVIKALEGSMINSRTLGFGLALALGLLVAKPVHSDEACMKTVADIGKAQATLTELQNLRDNIYKRQASAGSAEGGTAIAVTVKCDACGMMMPNHATGATTREVKIGGHSYFCCKGCDMSKQVDKE
jgi:hypothetical protein